MIYKVIILWIMLALFLFLMGYSFGRRVGIKEGKEEEALILPIDLKQKLLESSVCPLCHQKLMEKQRCDKISS